MLNLKIITISHTYPRWKMDIYNYNEISYYEKKIIDEIAIILKEYNHNIDEENESQDLPFN